MEFTPEVISALVGGALSFALSSIPGVAERWASYTGATKRGLLALAAAIVTAALAAAHFLGAVDLGLGAQLTPPVVLRILTTLTSAAGGAQIAYTAQQARP